MIGFHRKNAAVVEQSPRAAVLGTTSEGRDTAGGDAGAGRGTTITYMRDKHLPVSMTHGGVVRSNALVRGKDLSSLPPGIHQCGSDSAKPFQLEHQMLSPPKVLHSVDGVNHNNENDLRIQIEELDRYARGLFQDKQVGFNIIF